MSPCRLADRCHRFRQTCSLHLQGGRRATGHPAKCHIHDTSYRDKVKCHMCAQIPGDYILSTGVNTFRIIAAAYPLMQKKIVSADMQPAQWGSQVTPQLWSLPQYRTGWISHLWLLHLEVAHRFLVSLSTPWISLFKNMYRHRHSALKQIEVVRINTHTPQKDQYNLQRSTTQAVLHQQITKFYTSDMKFHGTTQTWLSPFHTQPLEPSVCVCFVCIWEQTAIISSHSINWLVFI